MILIYICKVKKGNALVVFFRVKEASQASHTFSSDKCVICQEDFDENTPAVIVHHKGLAALIKVSEERKMVDQNIYLARVNDSGVVMVRHNCQRKFTDARRKATKNEVPKKKLRSSLESTSFQWKEDCFLCSEKIDDHNLKREGVSSVMTLPIRDKLIKRANERSDEWGERVLQKVPSCYDLAAEEAVYHNACMNKFRLDILTAEKRGRPINQDMIDTFEKLWLWLENEADGELYTLRELHEKMSPLSNDATNIYSIKSLNLKLQEKYKDYIYFSEMPGRENVITFRQMANLILNELKKKESQTKEDIIIAAAK